jgi:3-oxoacyl-[acyl-carrier protein] reductase
MMDLNLAHKKAIVCGATQGIGKACAMELADLGASVILIARQEELLKQVKSELTEGENQIHSYIVADFSRPIDLKEKISRFLPVPIHILVNNTGGPQSGAIAEATTDAFEKTFAQHLICNHILAQAVIPGMKSEKYGRIINIISTSVKQPIHDLGVSNTIRAAVAHWAKTLSIELAPFGITVNNVLPGATRTERLTSIIENKSKRSNRSIEEISSEMVAEIPAARFGDAHEIAAAVSFLASAAASYINGINLPVDGGRTRSL